ncbi:hypothetical protein PM10SUCC1_15560 [Propionigenium maris DSM 9537]|uniref:Uncharacterized protein n=1 Tax=Propionigenium maris DSM 9537 TaxID=1123000 RepID=A0A9W6LMW3_9FUSO|nr:DUF6672 family protein [Propionigenium maris]GLI56042.1 hypothetical protein PM10SUCC1_15560 [Propionigenium maris DSM 9537]
MKRMIGAQLGLVGVSILLGIFLFVSGREHRVFVENKSIGEHKAFKSVVYTIDNQKDVKIKKNKKKLSNVKGSSHEIVVTYKKDGVEKKISREFKLKALEEATISIPGLVGGSEEWIEYKSTKMKQKS